MLNFLSAIFYGAIVLIAGIITILVAIISWIFDLLIATGTYIVLGTLWIIDHVFGSLFKSRKR